MNRDNGEQGMKRRDNSLGLNPDVADTLLLIIYCMLPRCLSHCLCESELLRSTRMTCFVALIFCSHNSERGDIIGEKECVMRKASTLSFISELVNEEPGSVDNLLIGKFEIY